MIDSLRALPDVIYTEPDKGIRTNRLHSLKTKMAVTVSALLVLLLTAMAYFVFSYFAATYKESIASQEIVMVQKMAREIDDKLDSAQETLIAISKQVTPATLADPEQGQAFLDSKVGVKTIFDNHIFFFSPTGRMIAESPYVPNRRGLDFSYRDYLQETVRTGKPYISKPYISSLFQHPAVMITAPIFDADGRLVGILGGGLDLLKDNFLGGLTRTQIGESGYIYLYDTDRTVILHPDATRILQKDVLPGTNWLFDKAIEGFEGTVEADNSRGISYLASATHLKKTNWILVANHPLAEVYAPVVKMQRYLVMTTAVGILLLVLALWFVVKIMAGPLEEFTRHVEEMPAKHGNDRFSTIVSDDEIGALSQAFNTMLTELDKQTASLEKSKELYQTVTDFASDMVFWRGNDGTIYYVSPNCERITGYASEAFYAEPGLLDEIVFSADRSRWLSYARRTAEPASRTLEFRIINRNGMIRWISCVSRHVFAENGELCGLRGSHQDISEQKMAEERLQYISLHDSLTGFYNRTSFEAALNMAARPVESLPVTIFVCDVDGLKFVNDTLGHRVGDELLVKVAQIIRQAFSLLDAAIYRIGGDEFVAVLANFNQGDAERGYQRLRELSAEYSTGDSQLPVGMSIGFAVSESDQVDMVALFKEADDAMYREKMQRNKSVRDTTMQALMKALEARDFQTAGHTDRLEKLAGEFAKRIALPEKVTNTLCLLAQFHDIGKIGIPDNILFKPGPLSDKERLVMQRHPEIGYRIAVATHDLAAIADLIFRHHEWWNGEGYPLRLKGEEIPLECRVLAIVDAYEAMTSDRPYRKALSHRRAMEEVARCSGTQFDPRLAELFLREFTADEKEYPVAR
ncbi:MAG: diguanylate cyclase [Negativicutes bacterium]|nr:diguanylate cyclase [Negativicutes bacterium]